VYIRKGNEMFSAVEGQLIRAALTIEQQKKEVSVASLERALGTGKDRPATPLIEAFVLYWTMILTIPVPKKEEQHTLMPLKMVMLHLLKHPTQKNPQDVAQVLGIAEELEAEGLSEWILAQSLKRKATTVAAFWLALAERMLRDAVASSVAEAMGIIAQKISSNEEEKVLYQEWRRKHLVATYVHAEATEGQPEHVDRLISLVHAFQRLENYLSLPRERVRAVIMQEFPHLSDEGSPDPGHITTVVEYLKSHHRADSDTIASLLKCEEPDARTIIDLATQQIVSSPEGTKCRRSFESLQQCLSTPDEEDLYCLYSTGNWMLVSDLRCDPHGLAVVLDDAKQAMYIEWTHIQKLEQLEQSLEWRQRQAPPPIAVESEKPSSRAPQTVAEKFFRAAENEPTLGGLIAIGKHLLTSGKHQIVSSEVSDQPEHLPISLASGSETSSPVEALPIEQKTDALSLDEDDQKTEVSDQNKLQKTLDALRRNPKMEEVHLAELLGLLRPASARFWKIKALEILKQEQQQAGEQRALQQTAVLTPPPATLPARMIPQPTSVPQQVVQDPLTSQAYHAAEKWCRDQTLDSRNLHLFPCTSRLFLPEDRTWIAVPGSSERQVFVAYRNSQFALLLLRDFITSLSTRLVQAWHQRGFRDATFLTWSHPTLAQVILPHITAEASTHDLLWIATIRVAFQNVSQVSCVVWVHRAERGCDIRVMNTTLPVIKA